MNSKFDIFLKLIQGDYDQDAFDKTLKELHKSFSMLSQDEQKYANIFIHDVRSVNAVLDHGTTCIDYISDLMKAAENSRLYILVQFLVLFLYLIRVLRHRRVVTDKSVDHVICSF